MRAVEVGRRLLQQLAQMHQVGEPALAVLRGEHIFRQLPLIHYVAQHRQHAALVPELLPAGKLLDQRIPLALVLTQRIQRGSVDGEDRGGQRAAQQTFLLRRLHRLQQPQQLARFGRGIDAVAVREIDRWNRKSVQRVADQPRLVAAAHQHGDIGRLHRPQIIAFAQQSAPLLAGNQPAADIGGALLRHKLLIVADADAVAGLQPEAQRRLRLPIFHQRQLLIRRGGMNRQKRNRLEKKRRIHAGEKAVHALHHARGRSPVSIERIVCGDLAAGAQIGKDIGAAKGVDRLFRVADQQQRQLGLIKIERAENTILLRIGILKFVNQRHRIAGANGVGQQRAARLLQRLVETAQQIVEAEQRAQALLFTHRVAHFHQRAGDNQIAQRERLGEKGLYRLKQRMLRRRAFFGLLRQHALGETLQLFREEIVGCLAVGPLGDFRHPERQIFAAVAALIHAGLADDAFDFVAHRPPLALHLADARQVGGVARRQGFIVGRRPFQPRRFALQPGPQRRQQTLWPVPLGDDGARHIQRQRIAVASPEIRRRLLKQRRLILYQLLLEQHAGLEGVQVKHALAEAVNSEDRRFVHLTLRRQQQRSGLREILNLLQQKRQHRIAARAAHAG